MKRNFFCFSSHLLKLVLSILSANMVLQRFQSIFVIVLSIFPSIFVITKEWFKLHFEVCNRRNRLQWNMFESMRFAGSNVENSIHKKICLANVTMYFKAWTRKKKPTDTLQHFDHGNNRKTVCWRKKRVEEMKWKK